MKLKTLKYWLKPADVLFEDFRKYCLNRNEPEKRRIFIDNKSDVLFVAHIDTVQKPKFIRTRKTKSKTVKRIYAHGLDDRLGCAIAHSLSVELKADLLICDLEEKCRSTGRYHTLKDYNWIVEFDRAGGDVVTYGLDCADFRTALKSMWKIGFGAFSDIMQLKTDSCCMNLGIGYEFAHSKDSYVNVKTMEKQLKLFRQFYHKYKDTKFVQDRHINDLVDSDMWGAECDFCGLLADVCDVFGSLICEDCFGFLVEGYNNLFVTKW